METMTVSTSALTSIVSGVLMCDKFGEMCEAAEFLMGHPIWTHEYADKALWERMKTAVLDQHPDMAIDLSDVTPDNYAERKAWMVEKLGESREIVKGSEVREKDPVTTAVEAFASDRQSDDD